MATIFALDHPRLGPTEGLFKLWFPLSVSVVPALLMVMTIRFRSFRNLLAPKTPRARLGTATVVVLILVGLVLAPGVTGLLVAYGYVLTAPLGVLTAPLRRRFFGEGSVAPPRPRLRSVFLPIVESEEESGSESEPTRLAEVDPEPRIT